MDNRGSEDVGLSELQQLLFSANSLEFNKILSYLDHSDIANVRLVCKLWEESSRVNWRNNSTLQITTMVRTNDEDDDITSSVSRAANLLSMKQIVEEVLVPSDPWNVLKQPFRKLKINGVNQLGIRTMSRIETIFWHKVGSWLKYLHLNEITLAPGAATQLHRTLCELTPNLSELVYTQKDAFLHEAVVVDTIIRGTQPNLTSIIINFQPLNYVNVYAAMMKTNERLRNDENVVPHVEENDPDFMDNLMLIAALSQLMINASRNIDRLHIRDGGAGELPSRASRVPAQPQLPNPLFPFDWTLLFETFSNLKKITHNFREPTSGQEYVYHLVFKAFLLEQIEWIRQVRNERPNVLNIDSWTGILFGGDVITKFCELSLPICCFTGKFERTTQSEFNKFLISHQNTLMELTITGFSATSGFKDVTDMWLPPRLTYLELERPWGNCLDFLAHVPNLKSLIFNNKIGIRKETSFGPSFSRQVQPLTQMKQFQCNMVLSEAAFDKITNLMPNLTTLSVGMDCNRWMTAGWAWRELEHLKIVQKHWNENFFLAEETFIRFADRFQKLKTFGVVNPRNRNADLTHFSDLSIYQGFLKMPQLVNVKIKFSSEVSDMALAALKEKISHLDT